MEKSNAFWGTIILTFSLLSSCLANDSSVVDEESDDRTMEWASGKWWTFELEGTLPATWMDYAFWYSDLREDGHEPFYHLDTTTTFVVIDELGPNELSFQRIAAENPELNWLAAFGLPLAGDWWPSDGYTRGSGPVTYVYEEPPGSGVAHSPRFFDFPLADGKSWGMRYMAADLNITAHENNGTFVMTATWQGREVMRYVFDKQVQWFKEFTILDGDQDEIFHARLQEHGTDFSGEVSTMAHTVGWICWSRNELSLPVTPVIPGCLNRSIQTLEGGEDSFWYALAYKGENPGLQSVLLRTPREEVPEVFWEDVCPCDDQHQGLYTPQVVGIYEWWEKSIMAGDDPSRMLWIQYRCYDVYQIEEGFVTDMNACDLSRIENTEHART